MYVRFRTSYSNSPGQLWNIIEHEKFSSRFHRLTIIDSRYHWLLATKRIHQKRYRVRLEFELKENVSANTVYYLIIYDCVIKYSPMSNVVRKIT